MNKSTYYNLNLPTATDAVDVAKLSENFSTIDATMHQNAADVSGRLHNPAQDDLDMGGHRIKNLGVATSSEDVATVGDVSVATQQVADAALFKSGGTMTGNIAMGGNKVTGLPTPTDTSDAVPFGDATWELYRHDVLEEEVSNYSVTWTDTNITQCLISINGKVGGTKTDNNATFVYFREGTSNYQVLQIANTMKAGNDILGFAYLFSVPKKGTAALGSVSTFSYTVNTAYFAPGFQNSLSSKGYLDGVSAIISTNSGTVSFAAGTDIKIWRKRV